jgi:TatD DNase family protein
MTLIDTHTHLDSYARRGDLPAVLERARAAGVTAMVAIGTEPDDWMLHRDLAREHAGTVHFSVGLHPCCVGEGWAQAVAQIEAFWSVGVTPQPVALGECGLDRFHLPKEAIEAGKIFAWQRAAFAAQLEIAKRLNCPLVVHSRGAFRECVEMIDASGLDWARVVFHCFSEGAASSPVAINLTFESLPAASIIKPMMLLPFTCSSSFSTKTSHLYRLVMRTIMAAGRAWIPILF